MDGWWRCCETTRTPHKEGRPWPCMTSPVGECGDWINFADRLASYLGSKKRRSRLCLADRLRQTLPVRTSLSLLRLMKCGETAPRWQRYTPDIAGGSPGSEKTSYIRVLEANIRRAQAEAPAALEADNSIPTTDPSFASLRPTFLAAPGPSQRSILGAAIAGKL